MAATEQSSSHPERRYLSPKTRGFIYGYHPLHDNGNKDKDKTMMFIVVSHRSIPPPPPPTTGFEREE